jgi:hypothetical protein
LVLTPEDFHLCGALAERLGILPEAELARLEAGVAEVLKVFADIVAVKEARYGLTMGKAGTIRSRH